MSILNGSCRLGNEGRKLFQHHLRAELLSLHHKRMEMAQAKQNPLRPSNEDSMWIGHGHMANTFNTRTEAVLLIHYRGTFNLFVLLIQYNAICQPPCSVSDPLARWLCLEPYIENVVTQLRAITPCCQNTIDCGRNEMKGGKLEEELILVRRRLKAPGGCFMLFYTVRFNIACGRPLHVGTWNLHVESLHIADTILPK